MLVMAKAPVPGQVKTRLGARIGHEAAASLAAACLLDTLDRCREVFDECHVALAGDLHDAVRSAELRARMRTVTLHHQHGDGLAERLVRAHADVARVSGAPVVQIGMDTPQVTAADLTAVGDRVGDPAEVVLGAAEDGGWWVLGVADPTLVRPLAAVEMSTGRTYDDTLAALTGAGATVSGTTILRDVDTAEDAEAAASAAPDTRFAREWAQLWDGEAP